jgi:nucleotide-binding universal stress UspA family protein
LARDVLSEPDEAIMIALKRILVPSDFSECAAVAIKYGRELAYHFGAELHLLHVVQDTYRYAWDLESVPVSGYGWIRTQRDGAEQELKCLRSDAPHTTIACAIGGPVDEILRYACEHEIGLIVIGTHGRGGVAHAFLGSVAERVVRKAPCPVLTVHHLQQEFVEEPATGAAVAIAR